MECQSIFSSFEDDGLIIPLRGIVDYYETNLYEAVLKITYKKYQDIVHEREHKVNNLFF